MTINQAKNELSAARARQTALRKEIDALREFIRAKGEDPDLPKIDLRPRNKLIYKAWKAGKSFSEIAQEFKLSPSTIRAICNRIECILENNHHGRYKDYKDIKKYK